MRNVRCWLFGHEWVPTHLSLADTFEVDLTTDMATCPRCGTTCAFVDNEEVADE